MENSKILIRIERKLHMDLKYLAIQKSITLNQVCIDLIQTGLNKYITHDNAVEKMASEENGFVKKITDLFKEQGLVIVLQTDAYVADYVFIFENNSEIPMDLQQHFHQIIQGLKMPHAEHAPNNMWVQIAQNYKILWSLNSEFGDELTKKLDHW